MMITILAILAATSCTHSQVSTAQGSIITIDASTSSPISPYIYGVNTAGGMNSPDLGWKDTHTPFTLARLGGNRMTAYNWETNASNAGSDWHNQNDGYMGASDEPGWTYESFMRSAEANGEAVLLTIPTAGYVSADKKADGDVNQTPDWISVRFYKSFAKKPGGNFAYPPDLTDRAVYQDEAVAWLEKIKSPKTPLWFMLDNEPDLWSSTHSRIHPSKPTYAEIIENNITYGEAIKEVAPKTLVFGPANYGYHGFHTFQDAPDANGRDFLDVYLDAMKAADLSRGHRILDVLDVHWYPEARGGGHRVTEDGDAATDAARIQAPRSLWDPTYVEDSWITQSTGRKPIVLLPTIQKQIADHYPGTKLSISEYNYGGGKDISGAIAQADVLGAFGRCGVFAACNWGIGPTDVAMLAGYNAFLNYDGNMSHFGDRGLAVTGESPADDSVYASVDSHDRRKMTVVAINKTNAPLTLHFALKAFKTGRVEGYVLTRDTLKSPASLAAQTEAGGFEATLPPLSIATFAANGAESGR